MANLKKIILNNMLFIKMFLVVFLSISLVAVLITFSSIRIASNLFIDTSSITNSKVLNQIKDQFETYAFSVSSSAIRIEADATIERVLQENHTTAKEVSSYYYHMIHQMEEAYSKIEGENINMIIASPQAEVFNMNYYNWLIDGEEILSHPITKQAEQQPDDTSYHFLDSPITQNTPMIIAAKALTDENQEDIYGYLYLSIREEEMKKYYEGFTNENNHVLLLSSDGQVMSGSKGDILGTHHPDLLQQLTKESRTPEEYQTIEKFNKEFVLLYEYLPFMDMYLVNLINKNALRENVVDTSEILLISAGIGLGAILISFYILRRMTASISQLVNQISDMRSYQFNKYLPETGSYETRKIAKAFNFMLEELQEYVSILLKTQEKQQRTELEVLQHQINPHFIYNTLASIKFLIKQNKNDTALATIDSFTSLLQNNLSSINEFITVEQELEILKSYVHINQTRYGDKVRVNFLVAPDCLSLRLPKLIIQPFLENAFFHGFSKKKQGIIQVMIAKQNNELVCEIIDNGDGIPKNKLNQLDQTKKLFNGIGIKNVHNRIQLDFGKSYGVDVQSEPGKGTKIKINLPILT